ncbi:MAG TPA: hypothetical protein VFB84_10395 [Micromonosporaceae bacterium]|nr:hypothetical protein [Micromonosporaceae bacterium]
MDSATGYTDRDLGRIALAEQAARVADGAHALVGKHGHDVPAEEWLTGLVAPVLDDARQLEDLAVAYARGRGLSWAQVAAATGLDAEQARQRWEPVTVPVPDDPDALVTELEHWFIRHLWLDVTASIPDPLRRLLDGAAPADLPSCLVCRKYAGGPVPAWAGRAEPPGKHLVDDELWRVGHGPTVFSPCGTLLVESRRHYLDYAEMTPEESTSYTALLSRLMPVIKQVTGAERVHVFSNMEGAPHFHSWLMPRRPADVRGRRFLVSPGSCSDAEAAEAVEQMRSLLAAG